MGRGGANKNRKPGAVAVGAGSARGVASAPAVGANWSPGAKELARRVEHAAETKRSDRRGDDLRSHFIVDRGAGKVAPELERAFQAIQQAHTIRGLRPVRVRVVDGRSHRGCFVRSQIPGDYTIEVGREDRAPAAVFVHEVAHYLDAHGFGDQDTAELASENGDVFAQWRTAVRASAYYSDVDRKCVVSVSQRQMEVSRYEYLLSDRELFARSYMQWIALRSQDEVLLAQVNEGRREGIPTQWADDDFASIAAALDELIDGNEHLQP